MHCIPSVSVHPSHAFFAGQSMDNKIVVYSCGDKVRQITKKKHSSAITTLDTHAKLISVQTASTLFQGMGSGRCTSGIGKLLNVTENSMHMTMGRVWLLFGILCFRVALPHADGMDWLKYGTRWFSLTFDCCSIYVQATALTINLFLTFLSSQPFLY